MPNIINTLMDMGLNIQHFMYTYKILQICNKGDIGMANGKYYVGLDMGTSSVGWAVTNENYELIRKKGKDLWGVRLFPEAETSADRRTHRVSRRAHNRARAKIGFLKELFADAINQIDPGFYQRLDESKFREEDKTVKQPYALFNDENFSDEDYYQKYPTIFHLISSLIHDEQEFDVRLVFLAVLNIFKHRGHFLNLELSGDGYNNLKDTYNELGDKYNELYDKELYSEDSGTEWLEGILSDKSLSRSKKLEAILTHINITKSSDKSQVEMWKLICGLKATLIILFPEEDIDEEKANYSFSFSVPDIEKDLMEVESMISKESYELILLLKNMYDWSVLVNIMKGENGVFEYLSDARVELYEKHKKDLHLLKTVYHTYLPNKYNEMFREMHDNNYSAYVNSVNSDCLKVRRNAKIDNNVFFASIKKAISSIEECEEKEYILSEIEKGIFLPKQLTSANGVIPYQVHEKELKKILTNASRYLPFLNDIDESGFSVKDRIIMVFGFQIPYYIGPIIPHIGYKNENSNMWSVRKENGRVFPWNFADKIDENASSELFIKKMIRHCTYLNDETVLPKNSILYEKFMVLNELNNLVINGSKPSSEIKQELYNNLFRKGKKVTRKALINYLKINGHISANDQEINIAGIDGDFTNTCSNYAKFAAAFKTEILTDEQIKIAEDIIYWATIYGDTKKFTLAKIKEKYGDKLSEEFTKRILGIKFKDWGRLSKELLCTNGADKQTGEIKTVIERMWDENNNFMELIASDKYTYIDSIEDKQKELQKNLFDINYDDLEGLYLSAPVKRMVWQTLLILKEIVKVMGCEPNRIFVEMARNPEDKKDRKDSRKKKLIELYKACKEDSAKWINELNEKTDNELRSKKLYLYYTQMGRCMYTGERIELSDLFNNNLYDIDHIYPRHFVKDDSIENNLVLVKKETNAHKTDNYPLEADVRNKCTAHWNYLKEHKFITDEKYKRLIRNKEFTDNERAGFIARQIVETTQGTKTITNIFEHTFANSEVVYSKATNVSAFRQKYEFVKCRAVNDFHHAHDAYLNIVVGNVYYTKFTKNPINFIKEYRKDPENNKYHMEKVFDFDVTRNGSCAWSISDNKSIGIVKNMLSKNTPLITSMTRCVHGGLFDQNIIGKIATQKASGVGYTPIKTTDLRLDVCKYGGYNKASGTYFFLVERNVKGKLIRTIESMPLYKSDKYSEVSDLKNYCETELGYKDVSICIKKIPVNSLLRINGFDLYLTGRTGNRILVCNAVRLKIDNHNQAYIKLIDKFKDVSDEDILINNGISGHKNESLYDVLMDKHVNGIYSKRPNPIGNILSKNRDVYNGLCLFEQMYILLEIIGLSQIRNQGADLRLLGGSKQSGVSSLSKEISKCDEAFLIQQSVSGVYTKKINMLSK